MPLVFWLRLRTTVNVPLIGAVGVGGAFAQAGVRVFVAYDNAHARELLSQRKFDLAITDVGRDVEGSTAGLALHELLKRLGIPIAVYSASWSAANRGREKEADVLLITNNPAELFDTAIADLASSKKEPA